MSLVRHQEGHTAGKNKSFQHSEHHWGNCPTRAEQGNKGLKMVMMMMMMNGGGGLVVLAGGNNNVINAQRKLNQTRQQHCEL